MSMIQNSIGKDSCLVLVSRRHCRHVFGDRKEVMSVFYRILWLCYKILITTPICAGVTIQMRESSHQVPEGDTLTVCADLTGELERDIVVKLATTTKEGFKGAGVYTYSSEKLFHA